MTSVGLAGGAVVTFAASLTGKPARSSDDRAASRIAASVAMMWTLGIGRPYRPKRYRTAGRPLPETVPIKPLVWGR
jgi:hypothetical protein